MMKEVILKPLIHRGQEYIGIYFANDTAINNSLRKETGARWSQTNRCWYLPMGREYYEKIKTTLSGKAAINYIELKKYLEKRKAAADAAKKEMKEITGTSPPKLTKRANYTQAALTKISIVNKQVLPRMEQQLKLKAYSSSTIRTYLNEMAQLLSTIKDIPADELTPELLKRYLVYCYEKLLLSENTLHSRINALKFYYEQVLGREKFFWEIPRPKKPVQLPKVLSKEEIAAILKATENPKHKVMIMLGYGCGLRVSEITRLEVNDLDENRMLLMVRRGKGKKDRTISLSPAILAVLREYKEKYKPAHYLFEGQQEGSPYSIRSLQMIVQAAKKKAGIRKTGSTHMLRHSFATHLLDKGTDVVFIQKLLGHNDIKTTLRYLHVTNKDILNILSPIEDIKDMIG